MDKTVDATPRQVGFSFDADLCIECHTCELACKGTHDLEPGVRWRTVAEERYGSYPDLRRAFLSSACRHCPEPACAAVCPTRAITKRAEDGVVVVDSDKCNGCADCLPACPYGVPVFGADGKMQKCDYCLSVGVTPVCARSCPTGALTL